MLSRNNADKISAFITMQYESLKYLFYILTQPSCNVNST